jgi:hypothetical protein
MHKCNSKQTKRPIERPSSSGLFHGLLAIVGLLVVMLGLLLLLILVVLALLAHSLGHELLEGHIVTFLFGITRGLEFCC